jgi:excinuclease UvrABC helicase subunit UvrB
MMKKNFFGGFDNWDDLSEMLNQLFGGDIRNQVNSGVDENGEWVKKTVSSPDGTFKSTVYYRSGFGGGSHKPVGGNNYNLKELKRELDYAVEQQDFEKAVELRDRIKLIEENKEKVEELQAKMKEAIEKQDFESAIQIRDEINKLNK